VYSELTPKWTDIVQAIGAAGSLLVAVVGFGVLIYQIKQLERAIRATTQGELYSQGFEILKFLGENSEIRAYFYEGKALAENDRARNLVLSATEIVADFFEHIVLQRPNLPEPVWQKWAIQIQNTYLNCPTLQEYFDIHKDMYCDDVIRLCEEVRSKEHDESSPEGKVKVPAIGRNHLR
jgi:hypothetical protein